jgi:hypothetical protein
MAAYSIIRRQRRSNSTESRSQEIRSISPSLTENLVRPLHQSHQIGRSYEPGILAGEVGVENRTGP